MLMKAVEARKKAEVVYVHINKLENTHSLTHTHMHIAHSLKEPESLFP